MNDDQVYIVSGFIILLAAFWSSRTEAAASGEVTEFLENSLDKVKTVFSLNRLTDAKPEMLQNSNVKAFLMMIRKGEGTLGANGYKTLYGGKLFNSYAKHPNVVVKAGAYTSTAAGAYQFLYSSWIETAAALGLKDFSPASQDLAALARIAARGALDDVINGRVTVAIRKTNKEWASLPESPYGQPVQTMNSALNIYANNGGVIVA